MSTSRRWSGIVAIAMAVLATARCADPVSAPRAIGAPSASQLVAASPALLVCPSTADRAVSRVIGPDGGSLSVAGTTIAIPAGAVDAPTSFTLRIPASRYLEIDVRAGESEHYTFARPVTVSIGYGRCASAGSVPLSAWYIETPSYRLLQEMDGVDDRRGRRVQFTTSHFSGYALAE